MIEVIIEPLDLHSIEKRLKTLESKAPIVLARAINRAANAAKVKTAKEISSKYQISSPKVKSTISMKKANRGNLMAEVESKGKNIGLYKFKVSPKTKVKKGTPKTYRASVKKEGGYKALSGNPKPFVMEMKNGHMGVFARNGKSRTSISELYGPAVPQMIKNEEIADSIERRTQEVLNNRIEHEISYLLSKG